MEETTKSPKAPAKPRKTAAKKTTAKAETTGSFPAPNGNAAAAAVLAPAPTRTSAPPPAAPRASVSRDEIARLAHKFWAERGHQHGHHVEDWLRAEQELRKKAS